MEEGVLSKQEKQKVNKRKWQRQTHERDRIAKGIEKKKKYEPNAKKIMDLSENQLHNLYDQIETVDNYHGVDQTYEKYKCEDSTLPVRFKGGFGYTIPTRLYIQQTKLENHIDNNPKILKGESFAQGAIIMACHGIFAHELTDQVSHLCDNSKCVRLEHLRWETPAKNNQRKGCPGLTKCNCCHTMHDVCIHEPKCMKITIRK